MNKDKAVKYSGPIAGVLFILLSMLSVAFVVLYADGGERTPSVDATAKRVVLEDGTSVTIAPDANDERLVVVSRRYLNSSIGVNTEMLIIADTMTGKTYAVVVRGGIVQVK